MKTELKTKPTDVTTESFLATLTDKQQREDSQVLIEIMQSISESPPVMWGSSIIGFGSYRYTYASGREGDWMQIGFSPRKGKISLYITSDAEKYKAELEAMGKHEIGKGCIYIKRLADVDRAKLTSLIRSAYKASSTC